MCPQTNINLCMPVFGLIYNDLAFFHKFRFVLLHFSHVIAHPVPLGFAASLCEELHSGSKQVEFLLGQASRRAERVQTGNVGIESIFCSWLYVLMSKCIIDTRGTFLRPFGSKRPEAERTCHRVTGTL